MSRPRRESSITWIVPELYRHSKEKAVEWVR
jgi:hypothetical protein